MQKLTKLAVLAAMLGFVPLASPGSPFTYEIGEALGLEPQVQAWLREAKIRYLKPAHSALTLEFALSDEQVEAAREALEREGRFKVWHRTEAIDRQQQVCAVVDTEVYLRLPKVKRYEPAEF